MGCPMGGREARLRTATLALAHVKSSVTDDRDADDSESEAETLLIVSAAEASELEPGIAITSRLYESGSISEQLIELSGAAALLVLGVASAKPRAEHGLLGPVEDRVVVHAHCPVVTVNGRAIAARPTTRSFWDGPKELPGARHWKLRRGGGATGITTQHCHHSSDGYALTGTSFRTNQRRQALIDSIRRIERPTPACRSMSPIEVVTSTWSWNSHWTGPPCSCWALTTVSSPGAFASDRSPKR